MRPSLLNPYFASLTSLKGVGDKLGKLFSKALDRNTMESRIIDLVTRLPTSLVDRRNTCTVNMLPEKGIVTLEVVVNAHNPPPRNKPNLPYRIETSDPTGTLQLVYFKAFQDHLRAMLPEGETRIISGSVDWFNGQPQISHPDYVLPLASAAELPKLEPVYPLTAGLSSKAYGKAIRQATQLVPDLPEWIDPSYIAAQGWPGFVAALQTCHHPEEPDAAQPNHPARQRLAFDEFLSNQLALALVRGQMKKAEGRAINGDGSKSAAILRELPFKPTSAQNRAIEEIRADMSSPQRMIRLLQGDVGAGKTLVALLALAAVVEAGAQGALMAPTEILARQHYASIAPLAAKASIKVALLTGREKGKARQEVLDAVASGNIDILVGTHALFQDDVIFNDLALTVIDEQHRFGVHQRLALQAKARRAPDLLVMTATPIPRTLALTAYGDMDVSRLDEKPPGRQPIETRVMPMSRMDDVIAGLQRVIASGGRAYWVCPLVEESEVSDLAAAEARANQLAHAFPGQVGLIHGRMKGPERDATMEKFKSGHLSVLVATTVIEVGVDVPEAVIMVIENAERFGLSQLHQLRGRVGRGKAQSHCLLLYREPLGETAKARLEIMRATEDGFVIAEEDLRLRGAGEMLGTQQSGIPLFRMADLASHGELLAAARDDARLIMLRDPNLQSPRGQALRHLLYLFERDEAIRLLNAG